MILEPALHACTHLSTLELTKIDCSQLQLRDMYYLKSVNFDLLNWYHLAQITNCPNVETIKVKNVLKVSSVLKVREIRYEIDQSQEMYLNNPDSEVNLEKLRELH